MDSINGLESPKRKSRGRLIIALIGGLIGILLLVSGGRATDKNEETPTSENESFRQKLTVEEYRNAVEMRVCAIASQVAGVGNSVAVVSLEGGFEYVYATEVKTSGVG